MNIQRYTWPVIVAAGLHGALFLMTPERSIAHEKTAKPQALLPLPESEKIVQIVEARESSSAPTGGGPALPVLIDPVVDISEKPVFPTPRTEIPNSRQVVATDLRSPLIPGDGSGNPVIEGIGTICGIGSLDRQPRATSQISPDYPMSLHQQGITGSVTVQFDVDTVGRVVRAEAVNYTRHEFTEPALRAVRNWRFEPGKRHGKAVPFRMTVPIDFTIDS